MTFDIPDCLLFRLVCNSQAYSGFEWSFGRVYYK